MLALHGGASVRGGRPWPAWPIADSDTERAVLAALRGGRWTVSWPGSGEPSIERRFAEAFAEYTGAPWAVAVDHGSGALVLALELIDVGVGDEVIVPVQTWVATATAVLRVGAAPVLVDVDPVTGCLDPAAVEAAVTPRTKAIVGVHLACTLFDIEAVRSIAERHGIALVEDCAQAHGAIWRGRQVGTWGVVGAFSFQTGKVLAAGEGGAVVSTDALSYERAQQLRADARAYRADGPVAGEMELAEVGDVSGANLTMSELHAALALDQLARLDQQHDHRERVAAAIEQRNAASGVFRPLPLPEGTSRRSVYEYAVQFDLPTFGEASVDDVARAVAAELERPVYAPDVPLYRSLLYSPESKRAWQGRARTATERFPGAEQYRATTLLIHHSALLGDAADADCVAEALAKVVAHRRDLP